LIDQIRALNRSIQIKLKQQDDAARTLSDLTKDNAADLQEENARLLAERETDKAEIARLRDELAEGHAVRPKAEGSSRLRNDVRLVRPELAVKLGVPAAMVLQQLWFILGTGVGRILDGRLHVTNTYQEWADKYFPFYSAVTLERAFMRLEKKENLVVSKQADGRDNRVKSYRLTDEGIKLMASGKKPSICGDAIHQNEGKKPSICGLPSSTESESNATTAASHQNEDSVWLAELARKNGWNPSTKEKEWSRFLRWCKKNDKEPSRRLFENSWIPNIEHAAQPKIRSAEIEPAEYSNWFAITYPNQERPRWRDAPSWLKDEFNRAQKERSASGDSV
jgi:hypothetical protein